MQKWLQHAVHGPASVHLVINSGPSAVSPIHLMMTTCYVYSWVRHASRWPRQLRKWNTLQCRNERDLLAIAAQHLINALLVTPLLLLGSTASTPTFKDDADCSSNVPWLAKLVNEVAISCIIDALVSRSKQIGHPSEYSYCMHVGFLYEL